MTWLLSLLIGLTIWSATALVDRYALTNRLNSKVFYVVLAGFVHLVGGIAMLFFLENALAISILNLLVALGIGFAEGILIYSLFVAFSREEVSRAFPLAAVSPFLTLLLGWLLLQDIPTGIEFAAFSLFVAGSIIVGTHWSGEIRQVKWSRAVIPMLVGSVPFSLMHVGFKFALNDMDFWTTFAFSRIGLGLFGIFLFMLFFQTALRAWRRYSGTFKVLLLGNQATALVGHGFYFFALTGSASAALVNAVAGIQSLIVFFLATVVSLFFPKLLHEKMSPLILVQKFLGILCVAAAVYLLQI